MRIPTSYKESILSIFAVLFLLGHFLYQLPISPVERVVSSILQPVQYLLFTNRAYYMYAPDPRDVKDIPVLHIRFTDGTEESYGLEDSNVLSLPLGILSNEKWSNITVRMLRDLLGEWRGERTQLAEKMFQRFALRVCEQKSVKTPFSLGLFAKEVKFGEFGVAPMWMDERPIRTFACL